MPVLSTNNLRRFQVPLDILRELSAMSIDQVFQKYGTNSAISPEEPQSLSVSVWTGSGTNPRYTSKFLVRIVLERKIIT